MDSRIIQKIYSSHVKNKDNAVYTKRLPTNPLFSPHKNQRPLSMSIEDAFFGDSGKGRITVEFNKILSKKKKILSLRYNGGANAGHECYIDNKILVTHQLPIAVVQEGATAIMGRGMVIHPQDLLTEIGEVEKQFGTLPASLLIDERAVLSLDTHRALETFLNKITLGGRGSTGRGIATAYGSFYERIAVTMKDFMSNDWQEILTKHYRLYDMLTAGLDGKPSLSTTSVTALSKENHPVGSEKEFIKTLSSAREQIKQYVSSNIFFLLRETWKNPKIPVTVEGAQGGGLDPYHGVYPDVTASRPGSRNINDSTYNIIEPEDISLRLAVMKTTYMSSVGKRILPTKRKKEDEKWFQETFDEKGRSTGRLRDIYEVSIPIGRYIKQAGGFDYLVATHIDAARKGQDINVVTHYTHKKTKKEMPYLPYQDYLDTLDAHTVSFKGWAGEHVKDIRRAKDLPYEARTYLSFLSKTIAPIIFGTVDPHLGKYISWLPKI